MIMTAALAKRTSKFAALGQIFLLLFVVVVHACPGFTSIGPVMHSLSMDSGRGEAKPCDAPKQDRDICQSVRDGLSSTMISMAETNIIVIASPMFLAPPVDVLRTSRRTDGSTDWPVPFHPVFKLLLPVSYLVLRI